MKKKKVSPRDIAGNAEEEEENDTDIIIKQASIQELAQSDSNTISQRSMACISLIHSQTQQSFLSCFLQ